MVTVKISEKGGQQSDYQFEKSEVTIGRMKGNDIVLPKGNVSKKHARLERRDGTLLIDDLDSTNGTYVNGRKITDPQEVTDNDKIYIGDFILQIERERVGQPPKAPPQPPAGQDQQAQSQPRQDQQPEARDSTPRGSSPPSPPDQQQSGGSGPHAGGGPRDTSAGGGGGRRDSQSRPESRPQSRPESQPQSRPESSPAERPETSGERPDAKAQRDSGPQRRGSSGPSSAPSRGGRGSAPSEQPAGSSPQRRPSEERSDVGRSPGGDRRADTARGSAPQDVRGSAPTEEPAPDIVDEQPERGRDEYVEELRRERRPRHPVGPAISGPEFSSRFDEALARAKESVAEVLLMDLGPDEFPDDYPASQREEEEFESEIEEIVDELDPEVASGRLVDAVLGEVVGLGPLERYLDDGDTRAIYVNSYERIVLEEDGERIVAEEAFSHPDLLELVAERLVDSSDGAVQSVDMGDGTTLDAVLPPLADGGPRLSIRKSADDDFTLADLVEEDVLSDGMRAFLEQAVETGRSILVAGPSSTGRQRVLRSLARAIPEGARLAGIGTVGPLDLPQATAVELDGGAGTDRTPRDLLDAAALMRPDRIVLDACSGPEAFDWIGLSAAGTQGSLTSVGGVDAADALSRLQSLGLLGSDDAPPRGLREQIARAVDLVVVVARDEEGRYRIEQIAEVQGVDLDAFRLNDIFHFRVDGAAGEFQPTGYVPLFYEDLRHLGADVDLDIFET